MKFFHFRALEKAWSYKCAGDRCIREHSSANSKRVPFMSCAMVCGTKNIWPMPTGKVSLSSRSLTFKSDRLQLDVKTQFSEAEQLLNSAYNVLLLDLKSLEDRHASSQADNLDKSDNQMNGENVAADHHHNGNGNGNGNTIGSKSSSAKAKLDANANSNCDINKITINAEIQTIGDAFLHMDMDESYELNVTSKISYQSLHVKTNEIHSFHTNLLVYVSANI